MKNSKLLIIFFISLIFTSLSIINAQQEVNIKLEPSGVIRQGFYEAKNSKDETISTNFDYDFQKIIVNGDHAFCIEPEVIVGSGGGYNISEFTSKEREVFSRIIYHGYDNTPRSNKDYVITQHVLWDYIDNIRNDLTINDEWSLKGINYSTEKSKIMNNVNSHEKVANFSGNFLSVMEGQTLIVEDLNHVLLQSDIVDNGGLNIKQINNKLEISVLEDSPTKSVIKFKNFPNIKENSSVSPILYSHPHQQNVIVGGNPNPVIYEVRVDVEHRAPLKILKLDETTNGTIPNTIFNLYDEDKTMLQTIATGEDGIATLERLNYGDYYIEEIFVPEPYILDSENILQEVTLSKNNNHHESVFENEKALGELKLIKIDRKSNKPNEDIKFNLYDITDISTTDITHDILLSLDAFKSVATSSYSTIKFTDLDISKKYALIEVSTIYGYQLSDEVHILDFEYIDQNTPVIENTLNVYNEREEVVIRAVKKDLSDKSVITNKHFVLELSDQEGNVIKPSAFNDGVYTWNALALETYNLKETVAPNAYSLSNKVIKIDTSKQTKENLYTVEFFNSKIPKTGLNNQTYVHLILLGLAIITITIFRKRKLRQ